MEGVRLTGIDLTVIIVFAAGLTGLGLYFTRLQKTTKDYFLAGRRLPWWAVMVSIVTTETSAATVVAAPAWAFNPQGGGLFFLQVTFGYLMARILIAVLFVPRLFAKEYQSIYTYLEDRFGSGARNIAGLTFFVTRALATGIRVYIPAIVIMQIVPGWGFFECVLFSVGIALIYTTFGGFRAVIWTDVILFSIYIIGALLAMLTIGSQVSLGEVFRVGAQAGKFHIFNFDIFNFKNSYTILAGFLGGCFLSWATHGTDQSIGQRLLACRNEKESKMAIIGSGLIIIPQFLFFLFLGIMLYVFYTKIGLPELSRNDDVFPHFIINHMHTGVIGILIATIFAAAMSTTSSDVNALANVTVNDFYKNYINPKADDKHYVFMGRVATILWGIILIGIAYIPKIAPQDLQLLDICLAIPSVTYGALLGSFLLAMFAPKANRQGLYVGVATSITVMVIIVLFPVAAKITGAQGPGIFKVVPQLGWTWYCPIGTATAFIMGYLASFLWPQRLSSTVTER